MKSSIWPGIVADGWCNERNAADRRFDCCCKAQPAKEYVTGEGFYYLGRKYRLKLIDDAPAGELRLHAGRFLLPRDRAEQGRAHFIRWYTDHAQPWLADRVAALQDRVAVKPKGVQVRDLGYRWASCGQGGKLYFHWRVILLPPLPTTKTTTIGCEYTVMTTGCSNASRLHASP